ncbi:hypothetical protein ACHAXT_004698 [Thalassiosira profunda]
MESAARPLLTQAGLGGGGSVESDDASTVGDVAGAGGGSPMSFQVEEGDGNGGNDDVGDGFNLLTQTNELFQEGELGGEGSSDSDCSSGSSSSSDDGESSSDSSSEEEEKDAGALMQERRARNIRRNEAFIHAFKSEFSAMNGAPRGKKRKGAGQEPNKAVEEEQIDAPEGAENKEGIAKPKRRGMLFRAGASGGLQKESASASTSATHQPLSTMSMVEEVKPHYPHRSKQILILCSQLVSIAQKSKFAWQMDANQRSLGHIHYSESSYQGETKLAAPSPILITGAGGTGKTSIVRHAVNVLKKRTNGAVAGAYVDCASSEAGSVAAVMDSAYRQLYECCQTGRHDPKDRKGRHTSMMGRSHWDDDDFEEDFDVVAADEEAGEEDLLERQRQRKKPKKGSKANKAAKAKANRKSAQGNTRLTRATKAASKHTPGEATPGLNESIQSTGRNIQNSGSVALFGRATSALIQANSAKKKSRRDWRCAILILDNADRILSWRKHGSVTPLTQIFLLPGVMGINLTLIFISRSSIFQNSPIHHPPEQLLYAVHPQTIHFDSYVSTDAIKSILHVPHVKLSIMGRALETTSCATANNLRSKLNDLIYTSMVHSFVPSVRGSTQDIAEIARLARLLFLEYVSPLNETSGSGDPSFRALAVEMLQYLGHDNGEASEPCHNSTCSVCSILSPKTNGNGRKTADINVLRQKVSERLDRSVRDSMRNLLSSVVMMPGRVLEKQHVEPYAKRLPYTTKFLLLAAYLCQSKRPDQDVNLFTTKNTGKSKRRRSKADNGLAYASSSKELKQRLPSFPLERLLSVFYSIIGQYGQHFMTYKEEGATAAAQLGTNRLFQSVAQLIASGLLRSVGSLKFDERCPDLTEMISAKFQCTINRVDARAVAGSVAFPLDKYCP